MCLLGTCRGCHWQLHHLSLERVRCSPCTSRSRAHPDNGEGLPGQQRGPSLWLRQQSASNQVTSAHQSELPGSSLLARPEQQPQRGAAEVAATVEMLKLKWQELEEVRLAQAAAIPSNKQLR